MNNSLPIWDRLSKKTVYKGRVHIVEYKAKLPNGQMTTYEVDHSETCAVAVLIRTGDEKIVLTHQFRFPLNRWIYDLPGGAKNKDESVEEAAIRECREEVGLAPKKLEKLSTFFPNPARTDWPAHVFFCNDFEVSELKNDDPSENVQTMKMPIKDFAKLVADQEIVDPMLLIAWHTARSKGYLGI